MCKCDKCLCVCEYNPINIYILNLGWVIVGSSDKNINDINNKISVINNAYIIRRWGTTKGLGELALNGPMENTVLDYAPDLKMNIDSIIMIMGCNFEKWKSHLKTQ